MGEYYFFANSNVCDCANFFRKLFPEVTYEYFDYFDEFKPHLLISDLSENEGYLFVQFGYALSSSCCVLYRYNFFSQRELYKELALSCYRYFANK